MHDSFIPLGGAVPLVLMQLREVIFGGVRHPSVRHADLAILTIFIAGLMISRTPEYIGKSSSPGRQFPAPPQRPRVRWPRGSAVLAAKGPSAVPRGVARALRAADSLSI